MFKVFAFLKRNTKMLSHDEYRAGHVGYHCCNSRRLKNIRGYLVNIWANVPLEAKLGGSYHSIAFNEPENFTEWWDGFPEVYFDSSDDWVQAATCEPTRATEAGLVIDPDWSLADGPMLFDPVPGSPREFKSHHLHMHETVLKPVERPEFKMTKIIQFFKKNSQISREKFKAILSQDYLPKLSSLSSLRGLILNTRNKDIDQAIRGFYPASGWHFSDNGKEERTAFCSLWDGATELYFGTIEEFRSGRLGSPINSELLAIENVLFSSLWYVEVDENLIILPNRKPAPSFYFR